MKNFLRKLAGFALGPVIGAVISFFTLPVTTYFINPTEFGKASMFTVIQSFIISIIYLGIDQSYTREYHRRDNKKEVFQNALLIPLLLAIIISFLIFLFRDNFSVLLFSSKNYPEVSIIFGLMIISSVIERFILLSIRMAEKAVEYSFFTVSIKIVIFLSTVILIFMGKRDFLTIVYSTIFGQIIADMILIIKYRNLFVINKNFFDKELLVAMMKFGFPLIIAASLSNLLNTAGRFFLRGYSTFHELGIYTAALKISNVLQIIQSAFTSFWVPTAYRWDRERRDIKNFSLISDGLLLVLTIGFFLILFFKRYIALILSSGYVEAQYVTGLLALTPILYTLSETSTLGIVFSGKSYYNVYVSLLSIIPNIILNYLLVPIYGTIGAGIASATAYVAFCFARTYFSRRCGFKISFMKQIIVILFLYIAACLNTQNNPIVLPITILLFILCIFVQIETIKKIKNVVNEPKEWDFT